MDGDKVTVRELFLEDNIGKTRLEISKSVIAVSSAL